MAAQHKFTLNGRASAKAWKKTNSIPKSKSAGAFDGKKTASDLRQEGN
ncbi:hypothetical protein RBE51_20020 [Pseudomonas taiwanensis]|nr:hypothetical protein [Pseudomonas taiwanensis]MDT8925080.1 hypothetical protein [Pseudomonas taiwanensis]